MGRKSNTSSLQTLIDQLEDVIAFVSQEAEDRHDEIVRVSPEYRLSAENLVHYQALRSRDLSRLQRRLKNRGMSRLAKAEGHALASLKASRNLLIALSGEKPSSPGVPSVSIKKARRLARKNRRALLGDGDKSRHALIMVTLPTEAAYDYDLVERMVLTGMRIARINCAHDDESLWSMMIRNVHDAAETNGIACKIAMDLAGPKIRTGSIEAGPKVIKVRPGKDQRGRLLKPARVWIGSENPDLPDDVVSIPAEFNIPVKAGDALWISDARGKRRRIRNADVRTHGLFGELRNTTYFETGLPIYADKALKNPLCTVGEIPALEGYIFIRPGDFIRLICDPIAATSRREDELSIVIPEIQCTNREVLTQAKVGESVLFDDGRFVGRVASIERDGITVLLEQVRKGGAKLRAEKGINFPESDIHLAGLTQKDRDDLPFVLRHSDILNMSFVNTADDVKELLEAIEQTNSEATIGVVLKIETKRAFNNLVEIILAGMQTRPVGIMIARGDLALEVGWVRLAVVQREIMKLCNAAHIPGIWATQVFESLSKNGIPSRPEMTDLWVAQRSDCVMLNKGPFVVEAIDLLDTVLTKMEPWHDRDRAMLPALEAAVA